MYILSNLGNPFAILEKNTNRRVERAIKEEFMFEDINILNNPENIDWDEMSYIDYEGIKENDVELQGTVQITKLVTY